LISADGERRWFVHGKEFTEAEFDDRRRRIIDEIAGEFLTGTKNIMTGMKPLQPKPKP
jgi:hypothetical protein